MERNARWWAEHHSIAQAVGKLYWGRGGKCRTMGTLSGLRRQDFVKIFRFFHVFNQYAAFSLLHCRFLSSNV